MYGGMSSSQYLPPGKKKRTTVCIIRNECISNIWWSVNLKSTEDERLQDWSGRGLHCRLSCISIFRSGKAFNIHGRNRAIWADSQAYRQQTILWRVFKDIEPIYTANHRRRCSHEAGGRIHWKRSRIVWLVQDYGGRRFERSDYRTTICYNTKTRLESLRNSWQ